jgi:glycosyltransferase involved in cell wall biosynthesis
VRIRELGSRLKSARPRPYFGPSETPVRGGRRLLLITMAFPPDHSVGSLRWQKLSAYVAERGWGLDVVTVDPSCLQSGDPSRLAELPSGTRVYGVPTAVPWIARVTLAAWTAYRRLRPRRQRRTTRAGATNQASRIARPDSLRSADVRWTWHPRTLVRTNHAWLEYVRFGRWARDAAALTLRLIESGVHEAVITSGPPHMAHDAGWLVSRTTGLPLIIDLRDPWSITQRIPEHVASPLWLRLAQRHERRAVKQATLVVMNTEPCRLAMCDLYPQARDRIITVMNGCDTDPLPPPRHGHRFVIAYAGAIYSDRDPRLLFRAAARLIREFALDPADFGIEFLGCVERCGSTPVSDIAREEGVEAFVTLRPNRPRQAALEFLPRAAMLVSLPLVSLSQDTDLTIPAKIFEYVQFDAWVLALAAHDSATGVLLRGSGADVVAPEDVDGIFRVLRDRFQQYRSGIRPTRIARDGRFSRRVQAERLLDAIEACTSRPPAAAPPLLSRQRA